MTKAMTLHFAQVLLIAGLALPFIAPGSLPALAQSQAEQPASGAETSDNALTNQSEAAASAPSESETLAQFKETLAQYGQFVQHERYGEVWVPSVTPPGWHPYPACQWVYTEDAGWYFKDDTPWGAIVHHYGRWTQDIKLGWMWVPDEDWSPGWVVWRTSEQWMGWAPTPPEIDSAIVGTPAFDNDKLWTFMAAEKFRNGCGNTSANTLLMSQVGGLTEYASLFELPPGRLVKLAIVPRWKIKVLRRIVYIPVSRSCRCRKHDPRCQPAPRVPPKSVPLDKPPSVLRREPFPPNVDVGRPRRPHGYIRGHRPRPPRSGGRRRHWHPKVQSRRPHWHPKVQSRRRHWHPEVQSRRQHWHPSRNRGYQFR